MITLLEIPLKDVSTAAIQDLKSKYPGATLRVEADNRLHSGIMDESQFWAILDLFDWRTRDAARIMMPAVEALSRFSIASIHVFHDILNEKLYSLDSVRFAEQVGSNQYISGGGEKHFSVDSFLYARCCVIANGEKFYRAVLNDPSKMPKEYTFESLLYLPREAWQSKTGRDDYDYFPEIWSETFSNPAGWPGFVPIKERLLGL